jgi:hypothetical protein
MSSIKISENMAKVAYHIVDGPFTFPYATDALDAVKRFPSEWSLKPWEANVAATARQDMGEPAQAIEPNVKGPVNAGKRSDKSVVRDKKNFDRANA